MRREGKEIQKAGETLLSKWLAANDLEMTTSVLDKLCSLHGFSVHESLFKAIGEKTVILGDRDLDENTGEEEVREYDSLWWLAALCSIPEVE